MDPWNFNDGKEQDGPNPGSQNFWQRLISIVYIQFWPMANLDTFKHGPGKRNNMCWHICFDLHLYLYKIMVVITSPLQMIVDSSVVATQEGTRFYHQLCPFSLDQPQKGSVVFSRHMTHKITILVCLEQSKHRLFVWIWYTYIIM